jgi:hypothetical protein
LHNLEPSRELPDIATHVKKSAEEAEILFTLIAERYERGSMLITSNLVYINSGDKRSKYLSSIGALTHDFCYPVAGCCLLRKWGKLCWCRNQSDAVAEALEDGEAVTFKPL